MTSADPSQNWQSLKDLLTTPQKILITTHYKPDGDALGSSLGLYQLLIQLGHDVSVVVPSAFPDFLAWLPDTDKVINFEENIPLGVQLIKEAEIVFCLDFNALKRTHDLQNYLKQQCTAKMVMIDHHLNPDDFADFIMSKPSASSTCELIYEFAEMMGYLPLLNAAAANSLYTGLVTDTGRFKFALNPTTLKVAGALIAAGADANTVNRWIFDSYTIDRFSLMQFVMAERTVVLPEFRSAYIYLSVADYQQFNYKLGDNEGLVNYPLMMRDIVFSTLISETDDMIKFSFRSKGGFPVNEFSSKHFEGGGHKNASGGRSFKPFFRAIDYFNDKLPKYKDQLWAEWNELEKGM